MLIQDALSEDAVELISSPATTARILQRVAGRLATDMGLIEREILDAVLQREQSRSTALPCGAAIPHCRLPGLQRFGAGVAVLHDPIAWDRAGNQVDVVLMLVGPSSSVPDHLHLLANSTQILANPQIREKLRTAPDAASARLLLVAAEDAVERRRSSDGMLHDVRGGQEQHPDDLADVARRFDW
jgi:nitrogen PTS system EIIA component